MRRRSRSGHDKDRSIKGTEEVVKEPSVLRIPYVGEGADGARRSAEVDRSEAECLPAGDDRDRCLLSAERWTLQAEYLDERFTHRP